jgi:2-keto-4-pentenoate hydratase/2-oxohepta-3-ene-1,7-dioic acid hydratase in catechol pathway
MRLLRFRADGRERFGLISERGVLELSGRLGPDLTTIDALLGSGALERARELENSDTVDFTAEDIDYLPPLVRPGKIVCIGVNYMNRNAEYRDGAEAPKYPSVFMRTTESLVGHGQPIMRPPESEQLDYEGEIVIVIGKPGRRIAREASWSHIAGLSLMNEGSVRDWLRHAKFNVTQGKNFERSGSWGPWIQTIEQIPPETRLHLTTRVNGELRQDDTTANLIFPFDYLISYLSSFMPLNPGDIIATGTPPGAGARFDPPRYLRDGDVVTVNVPELGTLENRVEDEIVA